MAISDRNHLEGQTSHIVVRSSLGETKFSRWAQDSCKRIKGAVLSVNSSGVWLRLLFYGCDDNTFNAAISTCFPGSTPRFLSGIFFRGGIYCYTNFYCYANFSIAFRPNFRGRQKSLRVETA